MPDQHRSPLSAESRGQLEQLIERVSQTQRLLRLTLEELIAIPPDGAVDDHSGPCSADRAGWCDRAHPHDGQAIALLVQRWIDFETIQLDGLITALHARTGA